MQAIKTWNSRLSGDKHFGTINCLVQLRGKYGVLSASHVLCPLWEGISAGIHPYVRIALGGGRQAEGQLANWSVPLSPEGIPYQGAGDAALALIDDHIAAELAALMALPTGVASPPANDAKVAFLGARSGALRVTTIHSTSTKVNMPFQLHSRNGSLFYRSINVALDKAIQTDAHPTTLPGDSGCMLYDEEGNGIGMLVGTAFNYPHFMPLEPILSLFGVTLVTAERGAANSIKRLF